MTTLILSGLLSVAAAATFSELPAPQRNCPNFDWPNAPDCQPNCQPDCQGQRECRQQCPQGGPGQQQQRQRLRQRNCARSSGT